MDIVRVTLLATPAIADPGLPSMRFDLFLELCHHMDMFFGPESLKRNSAGSVGAMSIGAT